PVHHPADRPRPRRDDRRGVRAGHVHDVSPPAAPPRSDAHPNTPPRGPLNTAAASRHTIVVVDDEEAICETLRDVFEEEGYGVQTALDGVAALDLLREMAVKPRVVILDLLMPRLDGNAVYAAMK